MGAAGAAQAFALAFISGKRKDGSQGNIVLALKKADGRHGLDDILFGNIVVENEQRAGRTGIEILRFFSAARFKHFVRQFLQTAGEQTPVGRCAADQNDAQSAGGKPLPGVVRRDRAGRFGHPRNAGCA